MNEKQRNKKIYQAAKRLLEAGFEPELVQKAFGSIVENLSDDDGRLDSLLEVLDCFSSWGPNDMRLDKYYERQYKPDYGDDKACKCGHPYYRHYDTYEGMKHVGCKYCSCFDFKPSGGG